MDSIDWHKGDVDLIHDAHLAEAAYSGAAEVSGWQTDTEFGAFNAEHRVYHKDGKAVVAYRGTIPSNKKDLGADALLAVGLQDKSNRFKRAVRTADKVVAKYGKENVRVVGHSLGASKAAYVSRAKGLKGTGFNTPLSVLNKRTYANFHNVSTKADPVAWVARNTRGVKKQTTAKQVKWNPHTLSNYVSGP